MDQKEFSEASGLPMERVIRPVVWYEGMTDAVHFSIYGDDRKSGAEQFEKLYYAEIVWKERQEGEATPPALTIHRRLRRDYFGCDPLESLAEQLYKLGIVPDASTDDRDKTIKAQAETIRVLEDELKFLRGVVEKIQSPIIVTVRDDQQVWQGVDLATEPSKADPFLDEREDETI